MAIPMTTQHPECQPGEIYLGNFAPSEARNIGWKTKRAGFLSYYVDGTPFLHQSAYHIQPYFVQRAELERAGVFLEE